MLADVARIDSHAGGLRLPGATDQLSSQLRKHERFRSRFLPGARDLVVYVPAAFYQDPYSRFPVLYLQDGQNLFDPATSFIPGNYWRVGETADVLIQQGAIQPLIVVGIYNTGKRRIREYTPTRTKRLGGGGAHRYARMLIQEIKPFIEAEYRTLPGPANTGLGGSSLGGLLTMNLGLTYPQIFGKLAVLSPSVWWDRRWIVSYAEKVHLDYRPRVWLDIGTGEGPRTLDDARKLREVLAQRGWQEGRDLHYEEIPGGQHNEEAWRQRVGPFLRFLFPAGEAAV